MSVLNTIIDVENITHESKVYTLRASPEERQEIACRLNIIALEKLEADLHLEEKSHINVTGIVKADVVQECVRTLKPVQQHIEFSVREIFAKSDHPSSEESEIDLSMGELIEPLDGPRLDLGEVVIQLLSLNLDPFPVDPESLYVEYKDTTNSGSPFEVLKQNK